MERRFKIGDVVVLKGNVVTLSGAKPRMTVVRVDTEMDVSEVGCCWFRDDELRRGSFPAEALQLVPEEK